MKIIFYIAVVTALAGCASSDPVLPTQANIDVNKYTGTWYEQARLPNSFQRDCASDVQADYTLQPGNTIKVLNQCKQKDGSVKTAQAEGRLAVQSTAPDFSKLQVRFAPRWMSWLPMVWGDYWIMKIHGDYKYSLVGTPNRQFLWVLSREKQADQRVVNELLAYAANHGFAVQDVTRTLQ
ncbi:apolipoprotein D and lipocalin family protein [Advenella incenata]|uniref:Outer membrane lipoprotein Blc n=1 Tax=Advenella incenata TaxID=267800 RepID=A0A4Q7V8U0_9BURK|nr:lipocalin family protein [Advenella incenata]RZT92284.1 apolipoprotein D and lipocalin family protein [Advenella incenata]